MEGEKFPKGFDKDRAEVGRLKDKELIDELSRPSGFWSDDVEREAMRRILHKQGQILAYLEDMMKE